MPTSDPDCAITLESIPVPPGPRSYRGAITLVIVCLLVVGGLAWHGAVEDTKPPKPNPTTIVRAPGCYKDTTGLMTMYQYAQRHPRPDHRVRCP